MIGVQSLGVGDNDERQGLGASLGVIQNVPICNAKEFGILLKGHEKPTKGSRMEVAKPEQHFLNALCGRNAKDGESNLVALGES